MIDVEQWETEGGGSPAEPIVSAVPTKIEEDEMDQLVSRASVPRLADLFRQGKKAGLIQAGKEYGSSTA